MPSDSAPATKRRGVKSASEVPPEDHRKRRRNRTTQSCLNCHTTKRMCDRKRPCSRCTQLGLTGVCVYEVDDPARKSNIQDERSRLQNRIAELERVVRELKNKPHPRWTDARETDLLHSPTRSRPSSESLKSPLHADAILQDLSPFGDLTWTDLLNWESSGSSASSYSHSPVSTPSPLLVSAAFCPPGSFPLANICHGSPWSQNRQAPVNPDARCNCMSEPACYNAAVDMALELRKAATVLARSVNHCFGSSCLFSTKIRELESLAVNVLRDTHFCPDSLENSATPARLQYRISPDLRPCEQVKIARDLLWDKNGLPAYDDSFMSWIPPAASAPLVIYP